MDFSTIDIDRLRKLPTCELPPRYTLQAHPGNGCAGDPPGFPSYFTRCIYTPSGNDPARGPTMVISLPRDGKNYVIARAEDPYNATRHAALLMSLWRPLPLDHERVRLWIGDTYRDVKHCYRDDQGLVTSKDDHGIFIFPVPYYKLRHFQDDPRFSEEWRTKERAAVEAYNRDIQERATRLATPENHQAFRRVVEFYPDHKPDLALIQDPPKVPVQWWETDATAPTPETCKPRWREHPINGSWCQWCGWSVDPPREE